MTDLDRRIEAAAEMVQWPDWGTDDDLIKHTTEILRAAFPELFTNPPTAWIAPWEATGDMELSIEGMGGKWDPLSAEIRDKVWPIVRDAHLAKDGE